MPQDTELHIDAALSNIAVMYHNDAMIADKLSPRMGVKKRSDKIKVYDKTMLKQANTYRRDKAPSKVIDWGFADDLTYLCEKWALKDFVSQDERDNSDPPIKVEIDTTEIITGLIELDREIRVMTMFIATANYSSATHYRTLQASEQWSEYGSDDSKPLDDIKTAKGQIFTDTLVRPNVIMIPYLVSLELARHPEIIEIIKHTHPDLLTDGGLPPKLQGLKVIEAGAGYDSAQQGQDASMSQVWSDYVWIGYVNPRPGVKTITFSVSPSWKGRIARRWHDNERNADAIEIEEQGIDEKIIAQDCGYLLIDVLS